MITLDALREVLGWCALINMGLLLYTFLMLVLMKDWVYRIHSRFFKLKRETFDATLYAVMGFYKILVFVFNIVPYIALRIVG